MNVTFGETWAQGKVLGVFGKTVCEPYTPED